MAKVSAVFCKSAFERQWQSGVDPLPRINVPLLHVGQLMFEELRSLIPESLLDVSGVVFNSGRAAFSSPSDLYVLGLNPGGTPEGHQHETVRLHTDMVMRLPENWSSFRDQSLKGRPPGTFRFQPRVLHLLRQLDIDPGSTPASNLIFQRSQREKDLSQLGRLASGCWPFHRQLIEKLEVKVVLCFGQTAADFVREKLETIRLPIEVFKETNDRGWSSASYRNQKGITVIAASHPSIANWRNPACDPTPLVANALARER